jgi:hypothetical protein
VSEVGSSGAPPAGCRHGRRPGALDETARRLSHEELAVARTLVGEGHYVRSLAERVGTRTADMLACGTTVEVKAFLPAARRGGRPPSAQAVANKLLDAGGQGAMAVIWAVGSGLTQAEARKGLALFSAWAAREGAGRLRCARLVGDGFDVVCRPPLSAVGRRPGAPRVPASSGGGPGRSGPPKPRRQPRPYGPGPAGLTP